jgi:hypothetical protein
VPVVESGHLVGEWVHPAGTAKRAGAALIKNGDLYGARAANGLPVFGHEGSRGKMHRYEELHALTLNVEYRTLTITGIGMDIQNEALESTKAAGAAAEAMIVAMVKLRGAIANDLTSIKAARTKVQEEVTLMRNAVTEGIALVNSPQFLAAVANTERMAAALKAIGELSETKLSVAVFSGGKRAPGAQAQ